MDGPGWMVQRKAPCANRGRADPVTLGMNQIDTQSISGSPSGASQNWVHKLSTAERWRWFVTGTYVASQAPDEPCQVQLDFDLWLRDSYMTSLHKASPRLCWRNMSRSGPRVGQWRGPAKRKWDNHKWRPKFVVSVEHGKHSRQHLHWHAVLTDAGPYWALDFDCMFQSWHSRHGRIVIREIDRENVSSAVGYSLKSLNYTLKDGLSVRFSDGLSCPKETVEPEEYAT